MPSVIGGALRHQHISFAALLALMVAALNVNSLGRFWLGDDTPVLAHMLRHSLWDSFFTPAVWQELSTANLTPWILLSFKIDYALAGLNPGAFYLHHLVALWLVGLVAAGVLAMFVERWLAWTGAALFLLGAPVLRVGDQLFTRHYLEGLLLALLALWCFLLHQRSSKPWLQWLALLCYALAMTAKEVYVPLGVLFIVLGSGSWWERVRQAVPYVALLLLYGAWRAYMLSGHVGGYAQGSAYLRPEFWKDLVESFMGIPALLFGAYAGVLTLMLFGVIGAGFVLRPRRLLPGALLGALVSAPLVPLVAYPGITNADRYLFLPWFLLCFAFCVQSQELLRRVHGNLRGHGCNVAASIACFVLALSLLHYRSSLQHSEAPYYFAVDVQMRHVWNSDASTAFMPDASIAASYGMVRALGEVKRLLDPSASIPQAALDVPALDASRPLYAYAADCTCMRDITATIPHQLAQFHHQLQHKAPLWLTLSNHDGWIAWSFGPYGSGSYSVVSDYIGNLPLPPRQNGLRTNIRRELDFYLRYTAPEGWVTFSPRLRLKPDGEMLTWRRD